MKKKPTIEHEFSDAAERRIAERERLIRQLSVADQLRVKEMRQQHERDVLERRQLQGANRAQDIDREFSMRVREEAYPVLRPYLSPPLRRSGDEIERMAAKAVDDRNRKEIAEMGVQRDSSIDRFLNDRGQSYEQFKGEHEQLDQQREQTRENNNITREIE